jgi:hypothetical protein
MLLDLIQAVWEVIVTHLAVPAVAVDHLISGPLRMWGDAAGTAMYQGRARPWRPKVRELRPKESDQCRPVTIKGPARQALRRTSTMRREYVVVTWGEMTAALLILGIMMFLLFV